MSKTSQISNNEKFNVSLVFFIITTCQVGVGIHGFQRLITQQAKQDAWISVILSFLFAHIAVFFMVKTLQLYQTKDLYEIHEDLYGKYVGTLFNFLYIFYYAFAFFVVLRNYIEVIVTWVFPGLSQGFIGITILLTVIYAFTGGFRVLVGIAFFSFFSIIWIPFLLWFPLEFAHYNHLSPVLATDLASIVKGAYTMTFTIVGFEILYFIYPFIKERKKAEKFAHLGLLATLLLYLFIMLVSIVYFSEKQLERTIWATLTLFSVVRLPFIERVEIITICIWLVILLPNLCFFMWAAYRGASRIIKIKPRAFLSIFFVIMYVGILLVQSRYQINHMNNFFSQWAFIIVFIYPFLLYIFAKTKKSIKNRVKNH
ncbi:spore gernimation protein [Lysinibacillus yapensis]|uniref:Spore gernimation protein n=1 Tax=Ureibacillus yapensis TaxID=2304605 RepID=A0A396SG45_9BACL|nr:GerAB/ArcD/ProY family transporter [Lysinibacillus yapensis]RHW37436.1 spore gernimation protein [Lysinibacillus yapensis]